MLAVLLLLCRLCLESYHVLAIGMPDAATQASVVPTLESDSSVCEQQQQQQDDDGGGSAGIAAGVQSTPQAYEQQGSDQQTEADAGVPVRAAVTDAGAAVSTALVAAGPVSCSAGGSSNILQASRNSAVAAPGLVRSMLPQLPLPHLLHLELDGCR